MFANNGRISQSQCMRLLFFDMMGIGSLMLPGYLAGSCETDGAIAIVAGCAMGFAMLAYLKWVLAKQKMDYFSYIHSVVGKWGAGFIGILYGLYYLVFGGCVFYQLSKLIQDYLLQKESFTIILLLLHLLAIYGIYRGVECRARVYEVLFYILLVPFLIMLALGSRDVEFVNLMPMGISSPMEIGQGAYGVFLVFAIAQMLLLTSPYLSLKEGIRGARRAMLLCGIIFIIVYEIVIGVFGTIAVSGRSYAVVDLMSTITLPGGFLRRQDAFMIGLWFFMLYAAGASGIFYGASCFGFCHGITGSKVKRAGNIGKLMVALVISYWISYSCYLYERINEWIIMILAYFTPFFLLLPIMFWLMHSRKKVILTTGILLCILFSGCSVNEMENRSFPLVIAVGEEQGQCQLIYKYQDLSKLASKDQASSGSEEEIVIADSFYNALKRYDESNGKVIDVNHVKVILLEEAFIKNEELYADFIDYISKANDISGNILLYVTQDIEELCQLQEEMSEPLGTYLEEQAEGSEKYDKNHTVTIGRLLNDTYNRKKNILVPYLVAEQSLPQISGYYLFKEGSGEGYVNEELGVWGAICQKTQVEWELAMNRECHVHLEDLKVDYEFVKRKGNSQPVCQIRLKGKGLVYGTQMVTDEEVEAYLQLLFAREVKKYQQEQGTDITNSYEHLAIGQRAWAQKYTKEEYESKVELEVQPQIKLLKIK